MPRPTLQTIADHAGVSRMTVSRALRFDKSIPEETRNRILAIAQRLNYRPNPLISALMSDIRSRQPANSGARLAFLTATSTEFAWKKMKFYAELHRGVVGRAGELGFGIETLWWTEPGMTGKRMTQILRARGIEGIVIGTLPSENESMDLEWDLFASSALGYSLIDPNIHRVASNQFHAIQLALKKLENLGYRRIGLAIPPDMDRRMDHAWRAGFFNHHAEALRLGGELLFSDRRDRKSFIRWMKRVRPDAVIGIDSVLKEWLEESGYHVPEDVGFVTLIDPSSKERHLACIHRDYRGMGAAAVDLVFGQLQSNERGIPQRPYTVLVEAEWRAGSSVREVSS
ncbi:MAG: LacI family DNA-binding transcriptional regulator [Verrucomicrobiota bacterium]